MKIMMSCKKAHIGDNAHMVIRGIRIRSFIHSITETLEKIDLTLIEATNATVVDKTDELSTTAYCLEHLALTHVSVPVFHHYTTLSKKFCSSGTAR